MPGLRQHYLPQFLLRGFSCKTKGKEVYTWVFSQNKLPFQVNIKKIGIEKGFYGDPDKSDLDDNIKLVENKLSNYVNELRQIKIDEKLDSSETSELIHHFFVRVKNVRSALIKTIDFIFKIISENLPSSDSLQRGVLKIIKTNPEALLGRIEAKLGTIEKSNRNIVVNELLPYLLEQNKEVFLSKLIQLLEISRVTMLNTISDTHLKALGKIMIPEKRISSTIYLMKHFKWSLIVKEQGSFILGDVGPIARITETDTFCSLLVGIKQFDLVLLPISNSHLIIGTKNNQKEKIDIDLINYSISSCSIEFFISSCNSSREEMYHSNLAKKSTVLPEGELEEIGKRFPSDFLGTID